jgi:hypothetical protein
VENDVILPTNILELDSVVRFFSGHARSQEHFESSLPVKQASHYKGHQNCVHQILSMYHNPAMIQQPIILLSPKKI